MKKQDYSGTPEYQEGHKKGAAAARTWRIAKQSALWRRGTRTQFRDATIGNTLRIQDIPEESHEGKAFSQGFTKAFNWAFTVTAGH